eukprot:scaffold9199_cov61-Phaeocystis_antarctica.AAC.3
MAPHAVRVRSERQASWRTAASPAQRRPSLSPLPRFHYQHPRCRSRACRGAPHGHRASHAATHQYGGSGLLVSSASRRLGLALTLPFERRAGRAATT